MHANNLNVMGREAEITLKLTESEAWDLLSRCLNSIEADTEDGRTAMNKLAKALQAADANNHLRLAA